VGSDTQLGEMTKRFVLSFAVSSRDNDNVFDVPVMSHNRRSRNVAPLKALRRLAAAADGAMATDSSRE